MRHYGEINGVSIAFTDHALSRMVEMELTVHEIKRLIFEPEEIYTSKKYPGEVSHRWKDFAMAFCRDEANNRFVVKTVLYATKAAWHKAERDGLLAERGGVARLDQNIPIG
jgi:hypothetical protein